MAQFLRPDGNITQTSFTGGFAEIDEATASDADFAYGANNTAATLEVSLTNPSGTPAAGTTTFRYRVGKTNNGTLDGAGNAVTVTASLVQGTTVLASDAARTATGTWTGYSFAPDTSGVTDWNDLRLRFVTSASGGSPANRRGGAVSWTELETPNAAPAPTVVVVTAVSALIAAQPVVVNAKVNIAVTAATGSFSGQVIAVRETVTVLISVVAASIGMAGRAIVVNAVRRVAVVAGALSLATAALVGRHVAVGPAGVAYAGRDLFATTGSGGGYLSRLVHRCMLSIGF